MTERDVQVMEQCDYSWITKAFCAHCLGHEADWDLGAEIR